MKIGKTFYYSFSRPEKKSANSSNPEQIKRSVAANFIRSDLACRIYSPIQVSDSITVQPKKTTPASINDKLKSIFVSVNFTDVSLQQAINFFHDQSVRFDDSSPAGVSFVVQPAARAEAKPVTLTLTNVSLDEALRYVCKLANIDYRVRDGTVAILPAKSTTTIKYLDKNTMMGWIDTDKIPETMRQREFREENVVFMETSK
jgi:hypothetical protein